MKYKKEKSCPNNKEIYVNQKKIPSNVAHKKQNTKEQ